MNALDLKSYIGKQLKFTYASGTQVFTTLEKLIPESPYPELLVCGGTDIRGADGREIGHRESMVVVPSAIKKVKEVWRKSDPRVGEGKEAEEFDFDCEIKVGG